MNQSQLKEMYKQDFLEALSTLEYSWAKIKDKTIPNLVLKNLDELESWEAFTARFARTTDIFLSKYIRLLVLHLDPGFRGEMRDYLDMAEKSSLISSADQWMKVRELRNTIAHEYSKEDLQKTLQEVMVLTPFVLEELKRFKN